MPRFSLKTMLIAVAVFALWFSTFSGYAAASDVRKGILLAILVASGCAAACFKGRRRAFWASFFVVMLVHGFGLFVALDSKPNPYWFAYAPQLDWCGKATNTLVPYMPDVGSPPYNRVFPGFQATFAAAWMLALSTVVGSVGSFIYDQSRKTDDK